MKKYETNANFVEMEHDVLEFWEQNDCFEKLKEKNKDNEPFRFLDGPITANNPMGIHHAWGRTTKDVYIRYKAMKGYSCHYRNGFDTQGLWVEVEVEKEHGFKTKKDIEEYGLDNFTRSCVERIKRFSKTITEQSKRLGQWMDWENSYFTHTDSNISGIWSFLKKCHENGWIMQSHRPMPWCPRCGTSLSEHEMTGSYKELEHQAVFFKLPLVGKDTEMLVWTTTPWTLSANVALAVNPNIEYCEVLIEGNRKTLILAQRAVKLFEGMKYKVVNVIKGEALLGMCYETCFPEMELQKNINHEIIAWNEINPEEGTGVVHIAPGCGAEDYELGKSLGLPAVIPVDETGIFVAGLDWLTGKRVSEVAQEVFDKLEKANKLFRVHKHKHSYPICWRCKTEVIFRLVKEWYIKTEEIKPKLVEAASKVVWEPEYIGKRMLDWLNNMGDWSISRKRFYGLPLPFYPCKSCGELTVIGSKEELKKLGGHAADELPELHRPWIDNVKIKCPRCGEMVERITEVGDVWLDAGIAPYTTLGYFEDKEKWRRYFPAEWVTEMREQVRLWFYSMLFMSVTLEGCAPYERVLAYNSVVAEDGSKFSKTGFMVRFDEAAEKIGVDAIRYLFAGANVSSDVRFGFSLGDEARRKLLGFWNIYIFFKTYADLDKPEICDFEPAYDSLTVTDKWLLGRINKFVSAASSSYECYNTQAVVKEFEAFVDEVSNWYIRVNRKRFWKEDDKADKKIAYWCLYQAIKNAVQVMAPIIPFVTEYIWQNTVKVFERNEAASVHLSQWPGVDSRYDNELLLNRTDKVRQVIALALKLRNEKQLKVRQPLAAMLAAADNEVMETIDEFQAIILDELNIKSIKPLESDSELKEYYLQLDFKKAGAVLKKDAQTVKQLLSEMSDEKMKNAVKKYDLKEAIYIAAYGASLSPELFTKESRTNSRYALVCDNGLTLALDTELNEDLILEGLYRDIIRQCQVLRKEAGFKVDQEIILGIYSDSEQIRKVVERYRSQIMQEALAVELKESLDAPELVASLELAENKVELSLGIV